MKVILLSGPPGAGKDEVASELRINYKCHQEAFAKPLKDGIGAALSVSCRRELELLKRSDPRIRKLMIGLSEDVIKPVMGLEWFATACAERVFRNGPALEKLVITDAGFQYEVDAFIDRMRQYYGNDTRVQCWRLDRPGHDYRNDSREPIYLEAEQGDNITLRNHGSLADLAGLVRRYAIGFWGER